MKRKIYLYILFGLVLFNSVVEAETCEGLFTYEAASLLTEIINYVRIGVPILLIILCASDFAGVVASEDDNAMKKAVSKVVKRCIAAAAIFFVPLIIQFVLSIDAVKNSLNLVDDPSCGIGTDSDDELKDKYKTEEELEKEAQERIEAERKKKEEEKKKELDKIYGKETYHTSSITGIRYILYNQVDSRWKDIPYGSKTVGEEGCPVIASSVIISADNNEITPADVVKTNAHSYPSTSVEKYAGDSFDCQMSRPRQYESMREFLAAGNVAVIHIKGPNAGGNNKFVPGNHYMALIDYDKKNDKIFVGNAFGSSGYAKSGWFDATTVLTSPADTHYCTVKQSLIDKHNGKESDEDDDSGSSLNISSSFKEYPSTIKNLGTYSLYIPKNATVNMPLIVVMPASAANYTVSRDIFKSLDLDGIPAFILVTHHLNDTSGLKAIKENIDQVVSEYKINPNKISITGFSSSGTYMYYVVTNNIGFFSAMVPISSGQSFNSRIQNNLSYFQNLPMKGYGETGGKHSTDILGNKCVGYIEWYPATAMRNLFKELGRLEDFTDVGKICHSEVVEYVFRIDDNNDGNSDVLMWMLSQEKKN